jgi:hypothetical protein
VKVPPTSTATRRFCKEFSPVPEPYSVPIESNGGSISLI